MEGAKKSSVIKRRPKNNTWNSRPKKRNRKNRIKLKNTKDVIKSIKERFKHVLGLKEPIVVLEDTGSTLLRKVQLLTSNNQKLHKSLANRSDGAFVNYNNSNDRSNSFPSKALQKTYKLKDVRICLERIHLPLQQSKNKTKGRDTPIHRNCYSNEFKKRSVKRKLVFTAKSNDIGILSSEEWNDSSNAVLTRNKLENHSNFSDIDIESFKYYRTKLWQKSLCETSESSVSGIYAQNFEESISTSNNSSVCEFFKRSAKNPRVPLIASNSESDRSSVKGTTIETKPQDSKYKWLDKDLNSCLSAKEPLGFCCDTINDNRNKTQNRSICSIREDLYSSPGKNSTKSDIVFLPRKRTDLNYIQNSFDNRDCRYKHVTAENINASSQQIDHIIEVANANGNKRRKIEYEKEKVDVACNILCDNVQGVNKSDSIEDGTHKNIYTPNIIINDKRDVSEGADETSSFVQDTPSCDKTPKFLQNTLSNKNITNEKRLPKITTDSILPKGTIKTSYIASDLTQLEKYKSQCNNPSNIQSNEFVTKNFVNVKKDFILNATSKVLVPPSIKFDASCVSELRLTKKNICTISESNSPVPKSLVSNCERIENKEGEEINTRDTHMLSNKNIAHNSDFAKSLSELNSESENFKLVAQYKHSHCAHNDTNNNEQIAKLDMPIIENENNTAGQTTKLEQENERNSLNITKSKIRQVTIENNSNVDQEKDTLLQNEHKSNSLDSSLSSNVETKVINDVTSSNCRNSNVDDDTDDDDDCISLFTDLSSLEEEEVISLPVKQKSLDTNKTYNMSDTVLQKFIENTNNDFQNEYNVDNTETNESSKDRTSFKLRESKTVAATFSTNFNKTNTAVNTDKQPMAVSEAHENETNASNCSKLFLGFCYCSLKFGNCSRTNCRFEHNLQIATSKILYLQHNLRLVLDYVESQNFWHFAKMLCTEALSSSRVDVPTITKIFEIMYKKHHVTNEVLEDIVVKLVYIGMSSQSVTSCLLPFISPYDYQTLNILMSCVKKSAKNGEYWNSIKCVTLITGKKTAKRVVEDILRECVLWKREHARDIHKTLITKLDVEQYNNLNKNLMATFDGILSRLEPNGNKVMQQSVASPDFEKVEPSSQNCKQLSSTSDKENKLVTPPISKTNDEDKIDKDTDDQDNSFVLHKIDNLPEPCSELSKERFWKFYLDKETLQEGLQRKDYGHVISVLKKCKPNEESLFLRACYRILCKEIKHSQLHLSNIIELTAESGSTGALRNMLIDVAIRVLARLTDEESWVLAYKLLKHINTSLQLQKSLHNFDAVVITLFAEIYLANDHPVEALDCFRQCNIIYTNRTKWLVPSNEEDDYIRARVITLLLDVLCIKSVDHAFFLFKFLVDDQWSNFYPIDLTRFVHKLVPKFLSQKQTELTISIGRLVDKYRFTLNTITYRALISTLVHSDVVLARQLYQCAVSLGLYSEIKFFPVTRIFVNTDLTEEEMYLMILDLIQQLLIHIGHGIDRVKKNEFSVYVIFETVPSEEQLYHDQGNFEQYNIKLRNTKRQLERVLQEKFDPPLKLVGQRKGKNKVCKLNSSNLKDYLTSGHWEGLHFALFSS